MKQHGVGVIGCGSVWEKAHRHVFGHTSRVKCVRVFDTSAERAAKAAEAVGAQVAARVSDITEADDLDIVAVLSPATTHADIVEAAAKTGKHFMLEKPMAGTLADAQRIVRAVREAGVVCFHPTLRALYCDLFDKLKELSADDGPLGPLRCGLFHMVGDAFGWASWFQDRKQCFPPAEYAAHVMDTFLALTGAEPASVFAHAGTHCRDFDQDDVVSILVTFRDGRYLQMDVNWVLKAKWGGAFQRWDLVCRRGGIQHTWSGAQWSGESGRGEFVSPRAQTQGNRWEHYESLADAIESGGSVSPSERDGLAYVRILDAALRSIATGQSIRLETQEQTGGAPR
jgi:predicted dehydrogenase